MLVHLCTIDCCSSCNEAAWKLRSMKRLLFSEVIKEVRWFVGAKRIVSHQDIRDHFPTFLRGAALHHECLAGLRWCYRHFRTRVSLWELNRWNFRCFTPGRMSCLVYVRSWARAEGTALSPKAAVTYHISACTLQRQWRIALYDPAYSVCRRKLLAEFEALKDPRP